MDLYICYQLGAGTVTSVGAGILGMNVPAVTRLMFVNNAVISGLPAGTYKVALCGQTSDTGWTNNEYSYTSAVVTN